MGTTCISILFCSLRKEKGRLLLRTERVLRHVRELMNLKKFIRWPSALNVAVHLQRTDELLRAPSPTVFLSDAENRWASAICSTSHRRAFVASRSLARQVLSVALDCSPNAVPILCQPNGKSGMLGQGIQFNISHCEDWCAVAWSAESAVGVGVEAIRAVRNMEDIVSNFFPPVGQQAFHSAAPQNRERVFFHWWTGIEAALKATGKGLDDSYECLDNVLHEVCDAVPGVTLAVAVVGTGPLTITWHLP